jgi:predicted choloylglycine hydrolase
MLHPRVKGAYSAMGSGYGTVLYRHGFRVPDQSTQRLDFGYKCEKEVRLFFPEILEEIRGFADACHASYENLAALVLGIGAFSPKAACSIFATFNGSDVMFGRNYDFYYSFKDKTESYLTCPKDGYWSVGQSDIFVGREDGINEKGLAIGVTAVAAKNLKPGVSFALATRYVLDNCATVDEAIEALSRVHFLTTNNYLLADRNGNVAVVEASPDKIRIRRPERGNNFIVCTNHFLSSEMLEFENEKERPLGSMERYATIHNTLRQHPGKIDTKTVQKLLSSHRGRVCSHVNSIKLGTLWSIIATLNDLKVFRAEGPPCRAKYRRDERLNRAIQTRQKTAKPTE